MRKIAIFAEGQTEQIFLRTFIPLTLSFECYQLYCDRMNEVPYKYLNTHAEVHFLIVDISNDEKVLSAVKDREQDLFRRGYEKIIALRDMYSKAYRDRAGHRIDERVSEAFIAAHQNEIQKMSYPSKIKMHFGIMEFEAWFLGMWKIFERIDPALSVAYIEENLGFNLSLIDPQTEFFKPADIIDNIMRLVNQRYGKSRDEVESICSNIEQKDLGVALEQGRCRSFKGFYDEITS